MEHWEVVVVGGGPAGLAGAVEAAKAGVKVLVVDENDRPGGQLFKQIHKFFGSKAHSAGIRGMDIGTRLLAETENAGVTVWLDSTVVGLFPDKEMAVVRSLGNGEKTTVTVRAEKILLACGGAENAVAFEGWTLPGVMGAGAAQTMINVHRVLPGKRVLMLGSGNVGLIVAYQLMQAGAEVAAVVEAAGQVGGYGVHAAKVRRAGVPFYLGHTVLRAEADGETLSRAVIVALDAAFNPIPGTEKTLAVDTICLAVGLRPFTQLALMRGIGHVYVPELGGWMPKHDENMETNVPGIYVAGDTAGVEEANSAMDEGRLAGSAIAQSLGHLDVERGEAVKREFRDRLSALRLGPFGEKRLNAKQRLVDRGVGLFVSWQPG